MRKLFLFVIFSCGFAWVLFLYLPSKFASTVETLISVRPELPPPVQKPCTQPIHYRVDQVDPQFNLSRDAFISTVKAAAALWQNDKQQPLFVYDDAAPLTVNLVFDGRQTENVAINTLQGQLQREKATMAPKVEEYQARAKAFKQNLAALQAQVDDWNKKGGAPPDVYDQLNKQQADLKTEADALNALARELNQTSNQYNSQVSVLNRDIATFNGQLREKPEEGIYDPNVPKIEIYFSVNKKEFLHTLEHEFGHALGLPHVDDTRAIMYSFASESLALTSADKSALATLCAGQD